MSTFLENAYNTFVDYCQHLENTARPGCGGMWTAENKKGDEVVVHQTYDGGYTGVVRSPKYGFAISFAYTYAQGNSYTLQTGTEKSVLECLSHCQDMLRTAPQVSVGVKPKK